MLWVWLVSSRALTGSSKVERTVPPILTLASEIKQGKPKPGLELPSSYPQFVHLFSALVIGFTTKIAIEFWDNSDFGGLTNLGPNINLPGNGGGDQRGAALLQQVNGALGFGGQGIEF